MDFWRSRRRTCKRWRRNICVRKIALSCFALRLRLAKRRPRNGDSDACAECGDDGTGAGSRAGGDLAKADARASGERPRSVAGGIAFDTEISWAAFVSVRKCGGD